MADNNALRAQNEGVNQSPEKKSNTLRNALAGLALTVATSGSISDVKADIESTLNLTEGNNTVHFVGGGTGELYKEGGKYYIRNGNSENGTDVFAGTMVVNSKVYIVSSDNVEEESVEISEYKSQIGLDYSKYSDMASNFLAGEIEYLSSIEEIIMSKPENMRERIRGVYYRNWEKALDDLYNGDGQIKKAYLDLFQEKTPNMVISWKGLPGYYGVIYENQRATEENQRATEENQRATEELAKEQALYDALNR